MYDLNERTNYEEKTIKGKKNIYLNFVIIGIRRKKFQSLATFNYTDLSVKVEPMPSL